MSKEVDHPLHHNRDRGPAAMVSLGLCDDYLDGKKASGVMALPTSNYITPHDGTDVEAARLSESNSNGSSSDLLGNGGRPYGLKSSLQEMCFIFSVAGSQLMTVITLSATEKVQRCFTNHQIRIIGVLHLRHGSACPQHPG